MSGIKMKRTGNIKGAYNFICYVLLCVLCCVRMLEIEDVEKYWKSPKYLLFMVSLEKWKVQILNRSWDFFFIKSFMQSHLA